MRSERCAGWDALSLYGPRAGAAWPSHKTKPSRGKQAGSCYGLAPTSGPTVPTPGRIVMRFDDDGRGGFGGEGRMVGKVAKAGPDLGVRGCGDVSGTAGTAGTAGTLAAGVEEVGSEGRRASPSSRSRLRLASAPLFRLVDAERPLDVGRDWGPMPWLPSALLRLGPRAGTAD